MSRSLRYGRHWALSWLAALLMLVAGAAHAGDALQAGLDAFHAKAYAKAISLWQPLAEKGNAKAQYNLGLMYQHGWGVKKDPPTALEWYKKSALQNNADAQYNLGLMYTRGKAVFRSDREAVKWWTYAATQGMAAAQYNLGVMYAYGMGCKQNGDLAVGLWQRAANQGNRAAARALAESYAKGEFGIKPDPKEAAYWRARAGGEK